MSEAVSCFVQYSNPGRVKLIAHSLPRAVVLAKSRAPLPTGCKERGNMISQRFRIKTPLIVILEVNGLYTSTQAAVGDIVTVTNGPLDGVRMVEVRWHDRTALMFTIELREQAELISETASGS